MTGRSLIRLVREVSPDYYRAHPLTTLVALAGIAVGVATFVAVKLTTSSAGQSFATTVGIVSPPSALVLRATVSDLDECLYQSLRPLMHRARIRPILETPALLTLPGHLAAEGTDFTLLGLDLLAEAQRWTEGAALTAQATGGDGPKSLDRFLDYLEADSLLVSEDLIRRAGLTIGARADLIVGGDRHPVILRARIPSTGNLASESISFGVQDIAAFQSNWNRQGRLDRIELIPSSESDRSRLKEDLTTLLPEGVTVTSPEGRIQRVNHMVRAYQFNLDALAFVALLVGGFFIHNGISVAVVTRQREIGLMRALGATRGQITAMFLAESTVLGMVAWIIGIFGGWGLSSASIESVAQTVTHLYVRSQVESVTPDVALLVVSLILALFVTLVASWIPARAAARIDPVRALRPVIQPEPETRDALPYAGAGIACLLVAGLSTLAPPVDGLPWFGLVAAAALVAGFSLLLPVIYVVLGRKGYSFAASGGASARLAFSFIAAHPVRTAVATASLLAAIALVSSMEIMVSSFRGTVMEWVENSLSGDLFVRSSAGPAGLGSRGLSAETASRISKVEGVASVDRVTIMDMIYRNSSVLLIAQEMAVLARNGRLMMNDGTPEAPVLERLHGEPGVIISESLAFHHNLHEGERIDLPLGGVARSLPILKIYRDYSADRGVLRMNRTHLESMLGHLEIGHVNVYVQDDAETESVRDRIRVVLSGSELEVTDARKIRMEVARTFDQTFKITIALRSVAAVVALLGIFGTLILFAQTEEVNFAILRLIGATRGQISGMLLWMGATLGVVGTIMGLAAGVALSAVIIEVLNRQSFGWTILYRPQLEGILALTLIAPLASLVASFIPAIRVSRKQTSRILHDE